ncbi:MAG: hypothetical protein R3F14_38470 [Polyangiaceae bacterium]
MYVVRFTSKTDVRGLRAFALRTAKRRLDRGGHRCLRSGEILECASCRRTAALRQNAEGYFLTGDMREERCG